MILTSIANTLVLESRLETALPRASLAAWTRPDGELGSGGDEGGEGIGEGVRGLSEGGPSDPRDIGASVRPRRTATMGMGADLHLGILALNL